MKRISALALFTAGLIVGGCQSSRVQFGGTIRVVTRSEPDRFRVLPPTKLPPAPWLEASLAPLRACVPGATRAQEESLDAPYSDDTLSDRHVVAANVDFAVVQTRRTTVAVSRSRGILGSLTLPAGTDWVGLTDNYILAADALGTLYRAALTLPFDFLKQSTIVGVAHWDAGGKVIAALANNRVLRSLDEGTSFTEVHAKPDAEFTDVAVRFDGVTVVQGKHRSNGTPDAWVARNDGTFQRSSFPVSALFRAGGIVGSHEPCEPRLSLDGTTWTSDAFIPHWHGGTTDWPTTMLDSSEWPQYTQGEESFIERPPIRSEKSALHRGMPCKSVSGVHRTLAPRIKISRVNPKGPHGAGAATISGHVDPEAAPRNTTIQWFGDGVAGVRESRAPTLGIVTRTPAALRVIQASCSLERVFSVGGIGLVVCHGRSDAEGSAIMTIDRNGAAYREGLFPLNGADPLNLSMATDGTLLLRHRWGDPSRQAFVRSPLALGSTQAWRSVTLGNAIEVRVTDGGGLLLIETGHVPVPASFSLILDRPGERKELFQGILVDGSLYDLFVNHREIVTLTKPFESDEPRQPRCQRLMSTGQLE